jgi:integrase/recombinase XerD
MQRKGQMSKQYEPKTEYYRKLLAACRKELLLLGYAKGTADLGGVGEFLQRMEMMGKTRLDMIEVSDLEEHLIYLQERPAHNRPGTLSAYTINGYLFSLRLLFDYGERHGLAGGNPLVAIARLSQPKANRRRLSQEEIGQLYAACDDDRKRAILHLLYGCGLRRMEVERLDLRDLDYRAALLYVRRGKGRKRRVVPLEKGIATELRTYVHDERPRWQNRLSGGAYLLNDRGRRMRGDTIAKHLKVMALKAGLGAGISPHALRHAIATHLLERGMSVERVRDFLGHGHLETTQLYTHVKTENL